MAMYYYASKLNEPSCSSARCPMRVPPAPGEPGPAPAPAPPSVEQPPIVADPALLRAGNGLSYYDKDDYYSMVRGNKFMSESACHHIVMNGGINFVTTQKVDAPQMPTGFAPRSLPTLPYVTCSATRPGIEYKDGQIISGTMHAFVTMLRPGGNKSFNFTFLLCSRLFVRPHELLAKLCKKYFTEYDRMREHVSMDAEMLRQERENMRELVSLLSEWTNMIPYDFRDDRVMAIVRIISEKCSSQQMTEARDEMSATLEILLDKLTALEQFEESLSDVPQMSAVEHLAQGDILTLGLTPIALANQLTLVELRRLSFIGPEEFLQAFAPRSSSPTLPAPANTSIKLHHLESKCTRNLESYADWFNHLSYLVATDILKSMKSKYRARVVEQWVMTARECFNLGNFNSLMAIISALNMAPITRLRKTWSKTSSVCGQQLRQLELCVDPAGNHARYRAALAAAPTETVVPLLSVTCRDLHFANQGYPSKLPGNRINYEKLTILTGLVEAHLASRRLTGVSAGAPATSTGQRNNLVWRFLNDTPTLTETALELTSFERESPADSLEKERLKRLRCAS